MKTVWRSMTDPQTSIITHDVVTSSNEEKDIRYRSLFLASRDAVMTLEPPDWKFTSGNPATIALFGTKDEKEFLSYEPWRLSPEYQPDGKKSIDKAKEMIEKAMKEGSNFFEWTHRRINGDDFYADVLLSRVEEDGKIFLHALIRDISKQKEMEKELLRSSEEKYRLLIEHLHDGIFIIKDEKIQFINESFARMAGYTGEDILGKNFIGFIAPSSKKLVAEQYRKRLKGEHSLDEYEAQLLRKDGTVIDVLISAGIITYQGKPATMGIAKDISARKKAEREIYSLTNKQRTILQAIPDIIMEVNNQKKYTWANQPGKDFFGEDVVGKEVDFYFEGEQKTYEKVEPLFKGSDDTIYIESWQRRKDGKKRLLAWWCRTIKDEKGNVTGALSSARDITEQKEMHTLLRESEQKLKAIFDSSPIAKFVIDQNHTVTYWSKALEELTGITAKEIVGTQYQWKAFYKTERPCLADLLIERSFDKISQFYHGKYRKLKLLEDSYEVTDFFPDLNKNGKWLHFTGALIRDLNGTIIGAEETLEDVTEHRKMEEKIIEDKSKDEAILDSIGDAVFACDKDGNIVLFNRMAEQLTGFADKEAIGHHYSQTLQFIKESDETPSIDFIAQAITENRITEMANHTVLVRRDGVKIPVADSAAPIKNVKGEIIGCVVVFHDVTHEREVDKAKTEFVSLASHQLRTPLSAINWYSELLLSGDNGTLTPKQRQCTEGVRQASMRMINLVNALLNVSRLELGTFTIEPELVCVQEIVKTCLEELKPEIEKKNLIMRESYESDVSRIQADPKLLAIIFQNLLSNAVKYTPKNGTIQVILGKKNDDILISVSDTGIGIPENQKERIGTKMFRADNTHTIDPDGTGLGIYIVKEIVKGSGGNFWFESSTGESLPAGRQGTTFYITMPKSGMKKKGGVRKLI